MRTILAVVLALLWLTGCASMRTTAGYRTPAGDETAEGKAAVRKNEVGKCGHLSDFTIPSFTAHVEFPAGKPLSNAPVHVEAGMMKRGSLDIGDHLELGFTSVASRVPQPEITVVETEPGTYVSKPLKIHTKGVFCKEYLDLISLEVNYPSTPKDKYRKDIVGELHLADIDGQREVADMNASFKTIQDYLNTHTFVLQAREKYVGHVTKLVAPAGLEAWVGVQMDDGNFIEGSCSWAMTPDEIQALKDSMADPSKKVMLWAEKISGGSGHFFTNVDRL
jgi:hypothetical protein